MFELKIKKTALKDLNNLDNEIFIKIDKAILSLKENSHPIQSQKLKGKTNQYRLRLGNYRILYEINKITKSITIYRIKHRQSAYKGIWRS